jgi:hypothetical protein
MKSLLFLLLCSVFVLSASDSIAQEAPKKNLAFEDLQVGHWYNFYFVKGHSPFATASAKSKHAKTSVTVHAAKVVSKKSKAEVKVMFPKQFDDHLSILSARAKDASESGSATVDGLNFKRWESEITKWKTIPIGLKHVRRISRMP